MTDIVLAGNGACFHMAGHFAEAAKQLGHSCYLVDTRLVGSWRLLDMIAWRVGKRPFRMKRYEADVLSACASRLPEVFIATGLVPISRATVKAIAELGVTTLNFLTDDPWNPAHFAGWRLDSIASYDYVFTPRQSNQTQLEELGVSHVCYMPFGYSKRQHAVEQVNEVAEPKCDLMFVGGADEDRLPIAQSLIEQGVDVKLYGAYWENYPSTGPFAQGNSSLEALKLAAKEAKISLILVRRANRDGHVMRSFESAAAGGCLLVEDTIEHRQIFGDDGCVCYFQGCKSMVENAKILLADADLRAEMRRRVFQKIVLNERNTYTDRLEKILSMTQVGSVSSD